MFALDSLVNLRTIVNKRNHDPDYRCSLTSQVNADYHGVLPSQGVLLPPGQTSLSQPTPAPLQQEKPRMISSRSSVTLLREQQLRQKRVRNFVAANNPFSADEHCLSSVSGLETLVEHQQQQNKRQRLHKLTPLEELKLQILAKRAAAARAAKSAQLQLLQSSRNTVVKFNPALDQVHFIEYTDQDLLQAWLTRWESKELQKENLKAIVAFRNNETPPNGACLRGLEVQSSPVLVEKKLQNGRNFKRCILEQQTVLKERRASGESQESPEVTLGRMCSLLTSEDADVARQTGASDAREAAAIYAEASQQQRRASLLAAAAVQVQAQRRASLLHQEQRRASLLAAAANQEQRRTSLLTAGLLQEKIPPSPQQQQPGSPQPQQQMTPEMLIALRSIVAQGA